MSKKMIACLVLMCALSSQAELYPKMGKLTIKLDGITSEEGKIKLAIYDHKDRWMKVDRAVLLKDLTPQKGSMMITVSVPIGKRYAVSVFQDINNNGELDKGFPIPKPTEPVGASNYEGGSVPRFYDCSFRFNKEPLEIPVTLRKF